MWGVSCFGLRSWLARGVRLSGSLGLSAALCACGQAGSVEGATGGVDTAAVGGHSVAGSGGYAASGSSGEPASGSSGQVGSGGSGAGDCSGFDAGGGGAAGAGGTGGGGVALKPAEIRVFSGLCPSAGSFAPCARVGADFSLPQNKLGWWWDGGSCGVKKYGIVIGSPHPLPVPHAGEITVTSPSHTVTLAPNPSNHNPYGSVSLQDKFWNGAEVVSASAPGSDIPAFDMSVLSPSAPDVMVAPSFPPQPDMLHIDRNADFKLQWNGGCDGEIQVELFAVNTLVVCTFPRAAGHGVVPAQMVARLPQAKGSLMATGMTQATTTVGEWEITLHAATHLITPAGVATTQLTVQFE